MNNLLLKHGALINLLLQHGPTTRLHLCELTGAGQPTVTRWINELIAAGLVNELGSEREIITVGRPPMQLDLNGDAAYVGAIHIREPWIQIGLVNLKGTVVCERIIKSVPFDPPYAQRLILQGFNELQMMIDKAQAPGRLLGIGVATAGIVNAETGAMGIHSFQGCLSSVPIRDMIANRFSVPIEIETNNWAMAIGEHMFGSRENTFVMVMVEEGIGAAVMLNGRLHKGGGLAGEIGHLPVPRLESNGVRCRYCGQEGCLSTWIGSDFMVRRVNKTMALEQFSDLLLAAQKQNPTAVQIVTEGAQALASICLPIVDFLHPDVIILAGPVWNLPIAINTVSEYIQARSFVGSRGIKIEASTLGQNAGLVGAASLVYWKALGAEVEVQAGRGWAHAVNRLAMRA